MEKKQKRYYKIGEKIWIKHLKKAGFIKQLEIDPKNKIYQADVEHIVKKNDVPFRVTETMELWEIDKYNRKQNGETIYFSRIVVNAVIPSKREEDAGYDIYACLDEEDIVLEIGKPTLVPTGIASALPQGYYLNCKHERGSTGKLGMSVLSGVVDSGYRGEIFLNICSLNRKIIITKKVDDVEERNGIVYYPSKKAVAQATVDVVPNLKVREIPYDELKEMKSDRGTTKMGASGK